MAAITSVCTHDCSKRGRRKLTEAILKIVGCYRTVLSDCHRATPNFIYKICITGLCCIGAHYICDTTLYVNLYFPHDTNSMPEPRSITSSMNYCVYSSIRHHQTPACSSFIHLLVSRFAWRILICTQIVQDWIPRRIARINILIKSTKNEFFFSFCNRVIWILYCVRARSRYTKRRNHNSLKSRSS